MRKYKDLNIILLIDDDEATNFYNQAIIEELDLGAEIKVTYGAQEALDFLTSDSKREEGKPYPQPGIIFLDINMPGMNGWDFLVEYDKLKKSQQANFVIAMLTTSLNPDDETKAKDIEDIKEFLFKPLNGEQIMKIIKSNFERL